jgi:hypothetical protein
MTKRRDFIRQSVFGSADIAIGGMGFTARSHGSIIGSNDRLNVAVIGLRSRGTAHIDEWCHCESLFKNFCTPVVMTTSIIKFV